MGGGSSGSSKGGEWQAYGSGRFQAGDNDFSYYSPYGQPTYLSQRPPSAYYMATGEQQNPYQVSIRVPQQLPVTPTPVATTQIIPAAPPTSPISSDSDSEERLREFFDWVKKQPSWTTPKLVAELETILDTLIDNFYDLETLRSGLSEQTWVDRLSLAAGLLPRLRRELKTFRINQKKQ